MRTYACNPRVEISDTSLISYRGGKFIDSACAHASSCPYGGDFKTVFTDSITLRVMTEPMCVFYACQLILGT